MTAQLLLYAGNIVFLLGNCWLLRLNKQYADLTGISTAPDAPDEMATYLYCSGGCGLTEGPFQSATAFTCRDCCAKLTQPGGAA